MSKFKNLFFLASVSVFCLLALQLEADAQSVGSGVQSFNFTATTTAARVQQAGIQTRYSEVRCWNSTSTAVYFGDTANIVYPVCDGTACPEAALSVAAANLYVQAASGSVVLKCIVLR